MKKKSHTLLLLLGICLVVGVSIFLSKYMIEGLQAQNAREKFVERTSQIVQNPQGVELGALYLKTKEVQTPEPGTVLSTYEVKVLDLGSNVTTKIGEITADSSNPFYYSEGNIYFDSLSVVNLKTGQTEYLLKDFTDIVSHTLVSENTVLLVDCESAYSWPVESSENCKLGYVGIEDRNGTRKILMDLSGEGGMKRIEYYDSERSIALLRESFADDVMNNIDPEPNYYEVDISVSKVTKLDAEQVEEVYEAIEKHKGEEERRCPAKSLRTKLYEREQKGIYVLGCFDIDELLAL